MSEIQTIAQHYERFAKANVPEDAPSYQRRDMKRAFYAGFVVMLKIGSDVAELDDEALAAHYEAIERELVDFAIASSIEGLLHGLVCAHVTRGFSS
jgi:hypothetical protein